VFPRHLRISERVVRLRSTTKHRVAALISVATAAFGLAALAAPAATAVEDPPGPASRYDQRRDHTGPHGASSVETTSCVGPHGEVYHRRRTAGADSTAQDTATTSSGDPAACFDRDQEQHDSRPALIGGANNPLVNVSTGDITVLSPAPRDISN
jgi:hypothetical protein